MYTTRASKKRTRNTVLSDEEKRARKAYSNKVAYAKRKQLVPPRPRRPKKIKPAVILPNFESTVNELRNPTQLSFRNLEFDPENAASLFHLNRGLLHFNESNEDNLKATISQEAPTDDELDTMIQDFQDKNSTAKCIYSCGVCGTKEVEGSFSSLDNLSCLKYTEEEKTQWSNRMKVHISIPTDSTGKNWRHIQPFKLFSYYYDDDTDTPYHLHRELVSSSNGTTRTFICESCNSKLEEEEIPKHSVKRIDFGVDTRLPLVFPNIVEQAVIAQARLYRRIVKIEQPLGQRTSKANMIVFDHDSGYQTCDAMAKGIADDMLFVFAAPNQPDSDHLMKQAFGTNKFKVRGYVLYQWMAVLNQVNPHYQHLNVPSFQQVMKTAESIQSSLQQSTITSTIQTSIPAGADIASVRNADDTSDGIQAVYVRNATCVAQGGESDTATLIHQMQKQLSSKHQSSTTFHPASAGEQVKQTVANTITRSEPLNEFTENDKILTLTFPDVFLTGAMYPRETKGKKSASLTPAQIKHLFLQFTNTAAESRELIFFTFNQRSRHSNMSGLYTKVKGNPHAFSRFANYVASDEFQDALQHAAKHPDSTQAKKLLSKIVPMMQSVNRSNPVGCMSTTALGRHMYNMTRHYGPASAFVTIALDDINNPTTFRLTQQFQSNEQFPAIIEDHNKFLQSLLSQEDFHQDGIRIPTGWSERYKKVSGNPIAAAKSYINLIDSIVKVLLKVNDQKSRRRTTYYLQNKKSILGYLKAASGCHETQARGALHLHLVVFGGLSPHLLSALCHNPAMKSEIAKTLDKMYVAQLPLDQHVEDIIHDALPRRIMGPKQYPAIIAGQNVNAANIKRTAQTFINDSAGVHKHGFSCMKPPNGVYKCRLCRPLQTIPETTCV